MQSLGQLVLQTQFHGTIKDTIVQSGEENIENVKPVSNKRPEKAKRGADRPCFLHKSAIFA